MDIKAFFLPVLLFDIRFRLFGLLLLYPLTFHGFIVVIGCSILSHINCFGTTKHRKSYK